MRPIAGRISQLMFQVRRLRHTPRYYRRYPCRSLAPPRGLVVISLGFPANKTERPITFLVLLSFGGSEIPSQAVLDFQGLKAYV